jgi:hydroxybutyrate-dimer hydrolase
LFLSPLYQIRWLFEANRPSCIQENIDESAAWVKSLIPIFYLAYVSQPRPRGPPAHHVIIFCRPVPSLNQLRGYNEMFIPLHRYFIQAMDLMYDHLRNGQPLPPSQVVHTTPRGPGAPPITAANVPPIADAPPSSALITFTGSQVNIPN